MPMFYLHVFSPLVGLLANVITQMSGCRYGKKSGLLRWVFIGFLGGFLTVLTIEVGFSYATKPALAELVGQITLSTITYVTLGYCYFHFINLGETARRVRILRELLESEHGLSRNEILDRYNVSDILNIRLQRMINNKQIVLRNDRYFIGKPVMLYMAKAIVMMKIVLLCKRGEF